MDRRRSRHLVKLHLESLEGRALTSTVPAVGVAAPQTSATPSSQITISEQERRIENLPRFLRSFSPNRALPAETTSAIQSDLRAIQGQLKPPGPGAITYFNQQLRAAIPFQSVQQDKLLGISNAFERTLIAAGADSSVVQNLQSNLTEMARFNAQRTNSNIVTTNDFSLVLQTALAVGRPAAVATTQGVAHPRGALAVK